MRYRAISSWQRACMMSEPCAVFALLAGGVVYWLLASKPVRAEGQATPAWPRPDQLRGTAGDGQGTTS